MWLGFGIWDVDEEDAFFFFSLALSISSFLINSWWMIDTKGTQNKGTQKRYVGW